MRAHPHANDIANGNPDGHSVPAADRYAFHRGAAGKEAAAGRRGPLQRRRSGRMLRPLYAAPTGGPTAVEAELRYDPNLLRATGVRRGPAAGRAAVAANTSEPGIVRVALASADPVGDSAAPVLLVMFDRRDGR